MGLFEENHNGHHWAFSSVCVLTARAQICMAEMTPV